MTKAYAREALLSCWSAARPASRPLLLVCAYRDEELDSREWLAGLVQSLLRENHARHMPLARLQMADAEALLDHLGDLKLRIPGSSRRASSSTMRPSTAPYLWGLSGRTSHVPCAAPGHFAAQRRFVEVGDADEVVAAELLLGLGSGTEHPTANGRRRNRQFPPRRR